MNRLHGKRNLTKRYVEDASGGCYAKPFGAAGITGEAIGTNVTGTMASSLPSIVGGRPACSLILDSTDSAAYQAQWPCAIPFQNTNDTFVWRFAIRFVGNAITNVGCFIGLANTDATIHSDTIGSITDDSIGIHKTLAGTSFTMVAIEDNGTEQTATLSGLTLAVDEWYDVEMRVKKTGTNTGELTVTVGTDTEFGESFQSPVSGTMTITSQFVDTGQLLRPSFAMLADTTNAVTVAFNHEHFYAGKV